MMSAFAYVASIRLSGVGIIRGIFAAMTVAALSAYFISSPLGGNATRLIDYVGAPLVWILLARQLQERRINRAVAVVVGAVVLCGQLAPNLVSASLALDVRSAEPAYWQGAITFLHAHENPNFRVEAVDSAGHWDAYYLPAAGIPIVRGWFRQDDFPDNALLYRPELVPAAYRAWLRRSGVRYVVLPHENLDYSATAEAASAELRALGPQTGLQGPLRDDLRAARRDAAARGAERTARVGAAARPRLARPARERRGASTRWRSTTPRTGGSRPRRARACRSPRTASASSWWPAAARSTCASTRRLARCSRAR